MPPLRGGELPMIGGARAACNDRRHVYAPHPGQAGTNPHIGQCRSEPIPLLAPGARRQALGDMPYQRWKARVKLAGSEKPSR